MKKTALTALALMMVASPVLANEHEGQAGTHGKGHRPGAEHFLKEVDTNKDGKVSRAEFSVKGDKMFAEADSNKDGFITADEMKAAHEARKAKWKARREEMKSKQAE